MNSIIEFKHKCATGTATRTDYMEAMKRIDMFFIENQRAADKRAKELRSPARLTAVFHRGRPVATEWGFSASQPKGDL